MNPATHEEPASEIVNALVAENRRLRRERAALSAELEALTESWWFRLDPRHLLDRVLRERRHSERLRRSGDLEAEPRVKPRRLPPSDSQIAPFVEHVVDRGEFSREWNFAVVSRWEPILSSLERARILEIGSFEGLSACYMLWRLGDAQITCVDTFGGSLEDHVQGDVSELEAIFERNVALVDRSRVRKLVGDSKRVLLDLIADSERYDLVYVDGSHLGLDVIVDAALSWQVLDWNGTLIFDDYAWAQLGTGPLLRPGPAIDAFLGVIEGSYETVFSEYQLALRKIPQAAEPSAGNGT